MQLPHPVILQLLCLFTISFLNVEELRAKEHSNLFFFRGEHEYVDSFAIAWIFRNWKKVVFHETKKDYHNFNIGWFSLLTTHFTIGTIIMSVLHITLFWLDEIFNINVYIQFPIVWHFTRHNRNNAHVFSTLNPFSVCGIFFFLPSLSTSNPLPSTNASLFFSYKAPLTCRHLSFFYIQWCFLLLHHPRARLLNPLFCYK